jgi:hypothetical protein
MDVFALIVSIVSLVAAVLNLILFFKVWGMTNNVKKMTKHFTDDDEFDKSFHYLYVIGKYDEVFDMLNKSMYHDLLAGVEENYIDSSFDIYKGKVFEFYKNYYDKVGKKVPESFYRISRSDLIERR